MFRRRPRLTIELTGARHRLRDHRCVVCDVVGGIGRAGQIPGRRSCRSRRCRSRWCGSRSTGVRVLLLLLISIALVVSACVRRQRPFHLQQSKRVRRDAVVADVERRFALGAAERARDWRHRSRFVTRRSGSPGSRSRWRLSSSSHESGPAARASRSPDSCSPSTVMTCTRVAWYFDHYLDLRDPIDRRWRCSSGFGRPGRRRSSMAPRWQRRVDRRCAEELR